MDDGTLCCIVMIIPIVLFIIAVIFAKPQSPKSLPQIKCPYCGLSFTPPSDWTGNIATQKPTSTTGNIARGIVFLPWGVVSAVKNKPYIQCPHCKMKIMQG